MSATRIEPGDERTGLARASAAVALGTLLSRVTGLVRVAVLAAVVGKLSLADTYNLANTTPNIVYELLLGGILSATLVPVFVAHRDDPDGAADSAVFTATITVLTAFTVVAMLLAPAIARLFAIGSHGPEHAAQLHVMTVFVLCFLPQMVFYGFTTLATAALNARRRFVAAAYAPVLNNVVVIVVLAVFALRTSGRRTSVVDVVGIRNDLGLLLLLGLGTTAGIVAMAAALGPALRRARARLSVSFDWRNPAVRTMLRLSGWTIGYVVANQVAQLFVLVLAKSGTSGNVSAYVYAFAFYQVPHSLLAVSIMTTMTPELAQRATSGDLPGMRRDFRLGLRYLVVVTLPASVLFVVLAQPMLGVLVHRQFGVHDAAVTADVLQLFALSLVPFSLYLYTLRAFYALHDTRTPFVVNTVENALNVVLALALFPSLGVQGLALAWSGSYVIAWIVATVALRRRVGGRRSRPVRAAATRAAVGSVVLASVAVPLAAAIGHRTPGRALLATGVAGGIGLLAYAGVLAAMRSDELRELAAIVRRRGARAPGVSP